MSATRAPRRWAVLVGLVLLVTLLRLEHATWVTSPTTDEIFHVGQGLALVAHGDARAQPENGILIQRLIGWAARLGASPQVTARLPATPVQAKDRFVFFQAALYDSGVSPRRLLFAARQAVVVFGLALCVLAWSWGRRLWGEAGGAVALLLVACSPDVLAHSALATSDAAFWCLALLAARLGWAVLQRPQARLAAAAGIALGAACATKFNGPLVGVVWVLCWLACYAAARRGGDAPGANEAWQAGRAFVALVAAGIVAWGTLWVCYGFEAHPGLPGGRLDWAQVSGFGLSAPVALLRDSGLVPEAFAYGLQHVLQGAQARVSFLAGEISVQGRLAYFPLALWWKTPVATLALLLLGLALAARALARGVQVMSRRDAWPLLALAAVFGASALAADLNIGVRHVMPAVLPLFVLAGAIPRLLPRPGRWAVTALLALLALESLWIHPRPLAFFNALAGGPSHGYRRLVDSNLDWGQGVDGLARYSQALPADTPLYYAYFGTAVPRRHGVRGQVLRTYGAGEVPREPLRLGAGHYAIGATVLPNLFEVPALRGAWRASSEAPYRALRDRLARGATLAPAEIDLHNRLLLARLLQFLRAREPDARIDDAILVYRLDDADVRAVIEGPLPP